MLEQRYRVEGRGSRELAASLEAAISSGELGPGERLPTVRRLAADLQLSPATVAEAYRRLRDRGLIEGAGRAGTRVRRQRPRSWRRSAPPIAGRARNLAGGNPDPKLLPDLRAALAATAARLADGRSLLYGQADGNPDLVDHFAAGFAADGIATERVTVVGGALDGIGRALAAHLRPGDRVAVEDPDYCGILDLLDACDLQPVPVAIDERGALPDRLERALPQVQAVVLTPRQHNPTGAGIDRDRLTELRSVLARHPQLLVVEDDHGALIADAPLHALAQGADRPHWAIARSLSKAIGPDLRLGALASDPTTAQRILRTQQATAGWVSHLLQDTALMVLRDPATERLLARARDTYARRRGALIDALAAHGVAVTAPGGMNVWLPVDDETTAAQTLLAHGWVLRSGTAFRLEASPALRVTTATLTAAEAPVLAADIARAVGRAVHWGPAR